MKILLTLITLIFLYGCNNNEDVRTSSGLNIDSLIEQNSKNFIKANEASKKSDTTITTKVDNTVKKIEKLETEIQQLKEENNELKNNLNDANDGGKPYRIRSISNN